MNRRTFLAALLASPVLIRAAFKNLPKAGDPIELPKIVRPGDWPDSNYPKKWIMVSTPGGDDRVFREYMKESAFPSRANQMWMVDWEDITFGPAPAYDPNKPEWSS